MTRCDHHLYDGPLVCTQQGAHTTHTYASTSGVAHCPKEEL